MSARNADPASTNQVLPMNRPLTRLFGRPVLFSWGMLAATVFLLSVSCRNFSAKAPSGFATYEDSFLGLPSDEFRAISADGVRFRVRTVQNDPEGDETLWTAAVRRNLEKKGYRILESKSLRTDDGHDLRVMLSVASLGGRDFAYLTAFCVRGKRIVLVEVGGALDALTARDKEVDTALRALRVP